MKTYLVGGAVRDALLGLPVKDKDYVVVGANADHMIAQGFVQVGADFPVFLHPQSKEEYALARSERKSGSGYLGFLVDTQNITLEQDLQRRDLTINAMAQDAQGNLIDPIGGRQDLERKVLRHVSDAFIEDPVRVLRIARFLARLGPAWSVHDSTLQLVKSIDLNALTPERVYKELMRTVQEPHVDMAITFLKKINAFESKSLEPYKILMRANVQALPYLSAASLESRCALLFCGSRAFVNHPVIPKDIKQSVQAYEKLDLLMQSSTCWSAPAWLDLLEQCGFFKGNKALPHAIEAWCKAEPLHLVHYQKMHDILSAAQHVDLKSIAASMPPGPAVGIAQRNARKSAIEESMQRAVQKSYAPAAKMKR